MLLQRLIGGQVNIVFCRTLCHMCNTPNISHKNSYTLSIMLQISNQHKETALNARHKSTGSVFYDALSDIPPVAFIERSLETVHDVSGLPWWASLAVTTVALRTAVTLPLTIYGSRAMARMEKLRPEIEALSKECSREVLMAAKIYKWGKNRAKWEHSRTMKRLLRDLYIRDNCHPYKNYVVLFGQIPLWICFSFALRVMSGLYTSTDSSLPYPAMTTEGTLWFTNFTVADPTYILPITMGIVNLITIEVGSLSIGPLNKYKGVINGVSRTAALFMVLVSSMLPSCLAFYWCVSCSTGLAQVFILRSPRVKRALGIPMMPNESKTPFQDMAKALQAKYAFKK